MAIAELIECMSQMWQAWAWSSDLDPVWEARYQLHRRPELVTLALRLDARCRSTRDYGDRFTQVQHELSDNFTAQLARITRSWDDSNRALPRRAA